MRIPQLLARAHLDGLTSHVVSKFPDQRDELVLVCVEERLAIDAFCLVELGAGIV